MICQSKTAFQLYISPSHISHLFKEETGQSPINYLIKCRIEESKNLLVTTQKSIKEIAYSVGYGNISYFNALFKKYTGMTPGTYRSSNKIDMNITDMICR